MKKTVFVIAMALGLYACGGGQDNASKEQPPVTQEAPAAEELAEAKPKAHPGKGVYIQYCQVCHMEDGSGNPGMYPPLMNSDWVTGDKERIIGVVLNGLQGEIEVNGEVYNGIMAAHNFLTDEQIANVVSYVRTSFGNSAEPVTPAEVAAVRATATN